MGEAALKSPAMTPDEFLAWEATQTERHDFVGGVPYAMAGAEDRHVTASLNVAMALRQHLSGSPCRTFMADMKVQAQAGDAYFYPDVVVSCSAADRESPLIKREPTLIVEVLSASTAAYDRGEKFAQYRAIASLQEVAFIDLDSRRSDIYRRGGDGLWVLHPFDPTDTVHFASVDLHLPPDVLFAELDD
ncbi:Uma2 family endonuclease [Roseateles sp. BYS180W]|uniref:Uma2 family endonuclease n=1 Tax=Roseateles rivi TaxID=3299028 RepID=A0ABW7FS76_9BURK